MATYTEVLEKVSYYVADFFKKNNNPNLLYHNFKHTRIVVQRTIEIAAHYKLSEKEIFILATAAWFHDAGQLLGIGYNHEEISVSIMENCLKAQETEQEIINVVKKCILATKLPHQPKTFLQEIICDADTYNLGNKEFLETDALLKREYELRSIPVDTWEESTLRFLLHHKYFTSYCQDLLNKGKEENILIVRERLITTDTENK